MKSIPAGLNCANIVKMMCNVSRAWWAWFSKHLEPTSTGQVGQLWRWEGQEAESNETDENYICFWIGTLARVD